jgi:hypothetical protein
MARIVKTEENLIKFDDGTEITCDHWQDCCEHNYADCEQIDDLAKAYNFNTKKLRFVFIYGSGFCFGDRPERMFFVPCYSEQNGYYTTDLDIYLNGGLQGTIECEEVYC